MILEGLRKMARNINQDCLYLIWVDTYCLHLQGGWICFRSMLKWFGEKSVLVIWECGRKSGQSELFGGGG